MTKKEAEHVWRRDVLPSVRAVYEQDGIPDYPARREAWNNWTDSLRKERLITRSQYDTWTHPSSNTAPWERRRR